MAGWACTHSVEPGRPRFNPQHGLSQKAPVHRVSLLYFRIGGMYVPLQTTGNERELQLLHTLLLKFRVRLILETRAQNICFTASSP